MSPPEHALLTKRTSAHQRLALLQKLLDKACDQLVVLDEREGDLRRRYKQARASVRQSARYSLFLQLGTVAAVKKRYYDVASRLAEDLKRLALQGVMESDRAEAEGI